MNLAHLKMTRPGQLLALIALALLLGVLVFAALPEGLENMRVAAYKAWLVSMFAALGLVIDLVVFHYARPGRFRVYADRALWLHAMYRRAVIIGVTMLAGGLAL
jgi:hypothetical protein